MLCSQVHRAERDLLRQWIKLPSIPISLHQVISCLFSFIFKKAGFQISLLQGSYFSDIENILLILHVYSQTLYGLILLLVLFLSFK